MHQSGGPFNHHDGFDDNDNDNDPFGSDDKLMISVVLAGALLQLKGFSQSKDIFGMTGSMNNLEGMHGLQ